jgi:hypothetical protein
VFLILPKMFRLQFRFKYFKIHFDLLFLNLFYLKTYRMEKYSESYDAYRDIIKNIDVNFYFLNIGKK